MLMTFFIEVEDNPKIHMEVSKTPNSQSRNKNAGNITVSNLRLYSRSLITYSAQNRQACQ